MTTTNNNKKITDELFQSVVEKQKEREKPPLAPHRKFIIEVRGEEIKVNKYGDKLHSLIDDLGWEYQRMGMSGRETYDEICHLLNMIPEDEVYMEI